MGMKHTNDKKIPSMVGSVIMQYILKNNVGVSSEIIYAYNMIENHFL